MTHFSPAWQGRWPEPQSADGLALSEAGGEDLLGSVYLRGLSFPPPSVRVKGALKQQEEAGKDRTESWNHERLWLPQEGTLRRP